MNNNKFKDYVDRLFILYDKYLVNREYKERSFENTESFQTAQREIANEIELIEQNIKVDLQEKISEVFPGVEVLIYDSRFFNQEKGYIGKALCRGLKSNEDARTVQKYLEAEIYYILLITRIEELSDDVVENIKHLFTK